MRRASRSVFGAMGAGLAATIALVGGQAQGDARPDAGRARTCHAPDGQALIPDGVVLLGEDGAQAAGREVRVPAFRIDRHEVTNRQFAAFAAAANYVSQAERDGAGAVFVQPDHVDGLDNAGQWWRLVKGASWRHPTGPGSYVDDRMEEPVVQVTYADAEAYARWAGRALPTEVQWERAARGDQHAAASAASWAYDAKGRPTANTWQGVFPVHDAADDGFHGLAPVGCFKANAFGLYDMIGNAWEWTTKAMSDPARRVVKGGSFLCSFNYCGNFRPAGWQAQEEDLPTSHIGFRTVDRAYP